MKSGFSSVLAFFSRVIEAIKPSRISERISLHNEMRAQARQERIALKETERLLRREKRARALKNFETSALRSLKGVPRLLAASVLRALKRAASRVARGVSDFFFLIKSKFPISLGEVERAHGFEGFQKSAGRFAAITAAGVFLWVLSVFFLHKRLALFSCLVAFVISLGFLRVERWRFSRELGFLACCCSIISVILGELLVQILFKFRLIRDVGISEETMAIAKSAGSFLLYYLGWFVLGMLLPAGVIAFFLCYWPFQKRFYWKRRGAKATSSFQG